MIEKKKSLRQQVINTVKENPSIENFELYLKFKDANESSIKVYTAEGRKLYGSEYKQELRDKILGDITEQLEKNSFKNSLFHKELILLYEKFYERFDRKYANHGFFLRPSFRNFVRNYEKLNPKEKGDLIFRIDIINSENILEKYILHQIKNTKRTPTNISELKEIKGLAFNHYTIQKKIKEHGLESRETIRDNEAHPDLYENYFEVIDSKEKAYLLGFIFADGWVEIQKNGSKKMGIKVNLKDECIIDNFIKCVNANRDKKDKPFGYNYVQIRIGNRKFCDNLIKLGVIPNKSRIIEMPKFETKEFNLAFLLGYFDGDGAEGTTNIASGSRLFLEQIRTTFNLDYKISLNIKQGYKTNYLLHLGGKLFNDMLDNYKHSLPRKRVKMREKSKIN